MRFTKPTFIAENADRRITFTPDQDPMNPRKDAITSMASVRICHLFTFCKLGIFVSGNEAFELKLFGVPQSLVGSRVAVWLTIRTQSFTVGLGILTPDVYSVEVDEHIHDWQAVSVGTRSKQRKRGDLQRKSRNEIL